MNLVPLAALATDAARAPTVPVLAGWNIWEVAQAAAPIDPSPGSENDQLARFVRDALGVGAEQPIALVAKTAAGARMVDRSQFPETAGPLALGVNDSATTDRLIAFDNHGAPFAVPWPRNDNFMLQVAFLPAPASVLPRSPSSGPVQVPNTTTPAPASPAPSSSGGGLALLVLPGLALGFLAFTASRRRVR